MYLVTRSSVPLARSMIPPVGLTKRPTSPFPVPFNRPATPSFLAPTEEGGREGGQEKTGGRGGGGGGGGGRGQGRGGGGEGGVGRGRGRRAGRGERGVGRRRGREKRVGGRRGRGRRGEGVLTQSSERKAKLNELQEEIERKRGRKTS